MGRQLERREPSPLSAGRAAAWALCQLLLSQDLALLPQLTSPLPAYNSLPYYAPVQRPSLLLPPVVSCEGETLKLHLCLEIRYLLKGVSQSMHSLRVLGHKIQS